jgi:hypothetical protein
MVFPARLGEIGFVLHNRPALPRPRPTWHGWELASFCTFSLLCRLGVPARHVPGANWLCFARLAPARPSAAAGKLGSFCIFCLSRPCLGRARLASFCRFRPPGPWPTDEIGFVLHLLRVGASRPRPPAPIPGRSGGIGFVLHNCPAPHNPAAPSDPAAPGIGFVLHDRHRIGMLEYGMLEWWGTSPRRELGLFVRPPTGY